MTTEARDWTYREATVRLVRAGRERLASHLAHARLDGAANLVVECTCRWRGNGVGWARHLESVVATALQDQE
jgi:hypothetical protein